MDNVIDRSNGFIRDELTGFYDLDSFKLVMKEHLDKIEGVETAAIVSTDIAHFERVNNLYTRKAANKLLRLLAKELFQNNFNGICYGRSVADHFLILVEDGRRDILEKRLQMFCDGFNYMIRDRYPDAAPRLGVGVYIIEDVDECCNEIVEKVNSARKKLRYVKQSNVAFYDEKRFKKAMHDREIEKHMVYALTHDEFKVYLQPKFRIEDKKLVGAEALARWVPDDGDMIYPDEFIPLFEENGMIQQMDFYVLDKVCKMIHNRLGSKKACIPISVNQSRVLLKSETYIDDISSVIKHYEIPSEFIELELTERIFEDAPEEISSIMWDVKKLGIHWSIDDFGSGYSSLNLFKSLPVDVIKLDKGFLDEAQISRTSKVIIRKTVELSRELDKKVVCEGVETEEQADYLKGINCDMAQGYFYARPMPMEQFERLLDISAS